MKLIKNEQLNFIKKQLELIKDSQKKNVPPTILKATIDLANAKMMNLFPNASPELLELIEVKERMSDKEYEHYIQKLTAYLMPFPEITEQEIKKIFPKKKKLKLPELADIDLHTVTYLSWKDIRANKKYVVYELDGELVGIEGEMTPSSKKNLCSFCNTFGEVAYFSTVTKARKVNNPDYYKSIGNLVCIDSKECNQKIIDTAYLQAFFMEALKK
ncbi:FusB/FusC family EF-G-binding protein [Bacillus sp. B1-b2]|uniref:FusB/FusC family EF-G-binding protein n=1 Tax=Bacillus sp. B1-b2 TaxID=2653201 RepID=UPI0012618043|nr:FusB/FusC family EF-G-binding protein [Bacillus sp. B1-b2]KAB7665028.1 elongation factor G-binding protein [Bacillus sp. B1-b2]